MHRLVVTTGFVRQARRLVKRDPRLKVRLNRVLKLLARDLDHPSLKLHKLSGQNNWSVSVTSDIRIIFHWDGSTIYCTEIGKHDEVY